MRHIFMRSAAFHPLAREVFRSFPEAQCEIELAGTRLREVL
jgi:hypothetical protein